MIMPFVQPVPIPLESPSKTNKLGSVRLRRPFFSSTALRWSEATTRPKRRREPSRHCWFCVSQSELKVAVVGAGIAGLATAVCLKKVGIEAKVFERRQGLPTGGTAIGLWTNAFRCLEQMGIADQLRENHLAIRNVQISSEKGKKIAEIPLGASGSTHELRYVMRADLLKALMDKWAPEPGQMIFGAEVREFREQGDKVILRLEDGSEETFDVLVGADGVNSCVRSQLLAGLPPLYTAAAGAMWNLLSPAATFSDPRNPNRLSGQTAHRGIARLSTDRYDRQINLIWGNGWRAGVAPIGPDSAYWFVVYSNPPGLETNADPEASKAKLLSTYSDVPHDFSTCVASTPANKISVSDLEDRPPAIGYLSCTGHVTLVGDGAHPISPDVGQGGGMSLEDAILLAQCLDRAKSSDISVVSALKEYSSSRVLRSSKLTLKARMISQVLSIDFPPVLFLRNNIVFRVLNPTGFLDHALYDPGVLSTTR